MGAIRGATCAANTSADISEKAIELLSEIFSLNNINPHDVDAVIFSATRDLDACYPARAVRLHFQMKNAAFMCLAEMDVEGSLDHCLRVCVLTSKVPQCDCKHCFLGRASCLRVDLQAKDF